MSHQEYLANTSQLHKKKLLIRNPSANRQHVLSVYVPASFIKCFALAYLILTATLRSGYYCCHLTDKIK